MKNYDYIVKAFRGSVRYHYILWFRYHKDYETCGSYMNKIIQEKYIYFSGWLAGIHSCGGNTSEIEKRLKLERYRLSNAYNEYIIYKKDFIKTMVNR